MPTKQRIKQLLYRTFYVLGFMIILTIVTALILSILPVNRDYTQAQEEHIEIFITSNGIHTDLVLPVATPYIDWRDKISLQHFAGANNNFTHIGFGWGDREFYMQTPEWSDLTIEVALSAMFWPSASAMHVEYIPKPLIPNKHQRPIKVTPEQYKKLVAYISDSFQRRGEYFIIIPGKGYTSTDNFYEAKELFYFPKNCNNWVNGGLKAAGLKAAFFAPFPYAVMRHYR
ncbi:TIGR02117 family protein [Pontibacter sp. KCTC 32443]|uniref:TIGR02117 family protein n=1 Tax=Pontibacter TaxID=323449 RepID=UPI00164D3FC7|nr:MULTISPECIES: TIGR02117 family protein [Pontibacter]MBC5773788.1 TIGR02117 family protein [Pontibacter sp. KCTC 32443]